jgi:hypothetical protein
MTAHKQSHPNQSTGLKGQICDVVKAAGKPLITKKIAEHFPDRPFQTVNSATNALVQAGWLRDSDKRESTGGSGRDAIAYEFDPNPQPKKQKKSAKVVDFGERKLVGMIEDDSIVKIIEAWAEGKSKKQRVEKAYKLVVPLIGNSRSGIVTLADEQSRVAVKEGRAFALKL